MMAESVCTARFGDLAYTGDDVIEVQDGLAPFSDATRFILVSHPDEEPFVWLQSLDDPQLALVLGPLNLLFPDHEAQVLEALAQRGAGTEPRCLGVYGVVVLHPDPACMTINLAAPLVIDFSRRSARQVVLDAPLYMTQQPLIGAQQPPIPG